MNKSKINNKLKGKKFIIQVRMIKIPFKNYFNKH